MEILTPCHPDPDQDYFFQGELRARVKQDLKLAMEEKNGADFRKTNFFYIKYFLLVYVKYLDKILSKSVLCFRLECETFYNFLALMIPFLINNVIIRYFLKVIFC